MIIISCGMPKSGTTLIMEYQKDLIRLARPENGLKEIKSYSYYGFIPEIDYWVAKMLLAIATQKGDTLVKTHSPPTFWIRNLIDRGEAKATFCFRDPRDTILSMLDHGKRSRAGLDPSGSFAHIKTVKDAIPEVNAATRLYCAWRGYGKAFFIGYEDLMADKMGCLTKMADYLGYECEKEALLSIFDKHEALKEQAWNFNVGTIDRWKTEMEPEDLALCEQTLQLDIALMGYGCGSVQADLNIPPLGYPTQAR